MKYLPIGIMAVSLVSGYTLLQSRVANSEDKLVKVESRVDKQSEDFQQLNVSQVQIQSKVDQIYDLSRDLKDAIKELKK